MAAAAAASASSASMSSSSSSSRWVVSVDAGTSSVRVLLYDAATGARAELAGGGSAVEQREFETANPQPGWASQDMAAVWTCVRDCAAAVLGRCSADERACVAAIGITNQRETTVAWDSETSEPLCEALVWHDTRTQSVCDAAEAKAATSFADSGGVEKVRRLTGLPISTYFSAFKMQWLMQERPAVAAAAKAGTLRMGTVDSWLVWKLTGGKSFITDVTNASRTCLMDLKTLSWSDELLEFFGVPSACLARIVSSAEVYGAVSEDAIPLLRGVPVSGVLGDQQAALVGQDCLNKGEAKNTYGTGCFLLYNTGTDAVPSSHGLLTTVGFRLGSEAPVHYALEGSVAIAGAAVTWLRDGLNLISGGAECSELAASVEDTGDLFFVPAFSGLLAPHWTPEARGTIVGITQYTTRAHLCRATLEAPCFQTREVLDAMQKDVRQTTQSSVQRQQQQQQAPPEEPLLSVLRIDGGMSVSAVMRQRQADLLGIPVEHGEAEATARGAFLAAAVGASVLAVAVDATSGRLSIPLPGASSQQRHTTRPSAGSAETRDAQQARWAEAVRRSIGWASY